MELDLLHRYEYKIDKENGAYFFTTDYGLKYEVTFFSFDIALQDYPEIVDVLFEFGFDRKEKKIKVPRDGKIKHTILYIIASFFQSLPNAAIYYVCDSTDKSQIGRKKLFEKWFLEYEKTGDSLFEKYDYEPEAEDMDLFISIIAMKTNPRLPQILATFEQVLQAYYIEK